MNAQADGQSQLPSEREARALLLLCKLHQTQADWITHYDAEAAMLMHSAASRIERICNAVLDGEV